MSKQSPDRRGWTPDRDPPTELTTRPVARSDGNLERAARLFVFGEERPDSPFIERVWWTRGRPEAASFISVAASHWEIVVTRQDGGTYLTVRGPETRASLSPIPEAADFFGIEFKPGAFMPSLPPCLVVDGGTTLPNASPSSFRINGSAWDSPRFDDAEAFVSRLRRDGLLVRDPEVDTAIRGEPSYLSQRTLQRRILQATGLSLRTLRQIDRAQRAVDLLDAGASILDTVASAGYADQAHLTRALKRFAGQTPAQISRTAAPA